MTNKNYKEKSVLGLKHFEKDDLKINEKSAGNSSYNVVEADSKALE